MVAEEFSNEFDVQIQAYNTANGLNLSFDEYEKSVFLTQAQNDLVKEYYTGINTSRKSFEETEEVRSYLKKLTMSTSALLKESGTENGFNIYTIDQYDKHISETLWFIIKEEALCTEQSECLNKKFIQIIPVAHDDIYRLLQNPFKGPNNRRVLKLEKNSNIYLYSKCKLGAYQCTYLNKPNPIILTNLEGGLTIDNLNEKTDCELNSSIHRDILERAIKLAIVSRSISSQKN